MVKLTDIQSKETLQNISAENTAFISSDNQIKRCTLDMIVSPEVMDLYQSYLINMKDNKQSRISVNPTDFGNFLSVSDDGRYILSPIYINNGGENDE